MQLLGHTRVCIQIFLFDHSLKFDCIFLIYNLISIIYSCQTHTSIPYVYILVLLTDFFQEYINHGWRWKKMVETQWCIYISNIKSVPLSRLQMQPWYYHFDCWFDLNGITIPYYTILAAKNWWSKMESWPRMVRGQTLGLWCIIFSNPFSFLGWLSTKLY